MGNRQRGDYFERQTRAALEQAGYYVMRSAGSYGPADLVGLKAGARPVLISCKVHGVLRKPERQRLLDVAAAAGARPLVGVREKAGHVTLMAIRTYDLSLVAVDRLKVPKRAIRSDDTAARAQLADTVP